MRGLNKHRIGQELKGLKTVFLISKNAHRQLTGQEENVRVNTDANKNLKWKTTIIFSHAFSVN